MNYKEHNVPYNEMGQYWQEVLDSSLQELAIDYGYKKTNFQKLEQKKMIFTIDTAMTDRLMDICRHDNRMLYFYLMAAFEVMLYKLTGAHDICLGVPYLKEGPASENLAILIRSTITADMSYRDFLNILKRNILSGYQNQSYPMEEALMEANCPVPFQNFVKCTIALDSIHSLHIAEELLHSLQSDFVITFTRDKTLTGVIQYYSHRIPEQFLHTLINVYKFIIQQTIQDLNQNIMNILVTDDEEMDKLRKWDQTSDDFKINSTVDCIFERNVELYGKNTALIYLKDKDLNSSIVIDYENLNERANQLAHILLDYEVKKGDSIGILMSNSIELVVAMLSILKVGGAFVPMDTGYPKERVRSIVESASIKLLLTNEATDLDAMLDIDVLNYGTLNWKGISKTPVSIEKFLEDTAYIIYTSGSTGVPKGVKVSHKGLLNFILWRIKAYRYSDKEVSLQLISPAFDGSLTNIFPILLSGGRCVYIHNSLWRDIPFVNQVIANQKITNFSVVPTVFRLLVEQAEKNEWDSVRFAVLAGEVTKPSLIDFTQDKYPHLLLINEYGPTEATITATAKLKMNAETYNCIGKPIANTSIYILNEDGNILPSGLAGELCIAGTGVVSGYIGSKGENLKRFCASPGDSEEILYKTGDIARWNNDGELEYLGRKDQLVKLHGIRIELAEITNILLAQENISDAYVWIRHGNDADELVGIVESNTALDMDFIKEKLGEKLPCYMIPGRLKQVDHFPVNNNDKIELDILKSLIEQEENISNTEPLNEAEQFFTDLWISLLHRNDFNIHSKFFDVGGNSMLIMLMHNEVEKKYPGVITIPDYFSYATIKNLAELVMLRRKDHTSES